MYTITETLKKILHDTASAENLEKDFSFSILERYKYFLINFVKRYEHFASNRVKKTFLLVQIFLGATGAGLGFFLIYAGASQSVQLTIWISYIILYVVVSITLHVIPDDLHRFNLEASKIRLINIAEKLAAQLALFNLVGKTGRIEDEDAILKISESIRDLTTYNEEVRSKITSCQDKNKVFTDSRETNIVIGEPELSIDKLTQLRDILRQIVELCGHLFAGRDFSAKIYLRITKVFYDEKVEILVPFAKYPPTDATERGAFGSSWIKARGNPSKVWECLEKGKTIHAKKKDFGTHTAYYSTALMICIPGRIGVLAITSAQEDAFTNQFDEWIERSLSIPLKTTIYQIFNILE